MSHAILKAKYIKALKVWYLIQHQVLSSGLSDKIENRNCLVEKGGVGFRFLRNHQGTPKLL